MKHLILILLSFSIARLYAQEKQGPSLSIAYFGETITHPGLKVGLNFPVYSWEKIKTKRNGAEKHLQKSFDVQPSVGFYYHQDYQTGLFVLPQVAYTRKNAQGAYTSFGLGAGYMRTFIPRVYALENDGVEKVGGGYHYLLSNYFITLGKDLSVTSKLPVELFCQPQALYATPNTKPGIWYFALEMGVKVKLK